MKRSCDKIYLMFLAVILIVPLAFFAPAALATEYSFTTVDVAGVLKGINDQGTIVGMYGFLDASGNFTPMINYPDPDAWTIPMGINNSNEIVGYYIDATGWHGFVATPIYQVVIDINPNHINPKSNGELSVAILSTSDFDAPSQVDQNSLTFGSTGEEASLAYCNPKEKDINRDGLKDLLCHFYTQNADFQCGDTEGILKGKTVQGIPIKGSDSVKIGPCK